MEWKLCPVDLLLETWIGVAAEIAGSSCNVIWHRFSHAALVPSDDRIPCAWSAPEDSKRASFLVLDDLSLEVDGPYVEHLSKETLGEELGFAKGGCKRPEEVSH